MNNEQLAPDEVQRFFKFLSWKQRKQKTKLKFINFVHVLEDQLSNKLPILGSQTQKLEYIDGLVTLRNNVMTKVVKIDAAIETLHNDPVIAKALEIRDQFMRELVEKHNVVSTAP